MQAIVSPGQNYQVHIVFQVDSATWQANCTSSGDPASLILALAKIENLPSASADLTAAIAQVQAGKAQLATVKAKVAELAALVEPAQ
jgi:hypothetical protein